MFRILIVEDEHQMRLGLKDNLEFEGYEVGEAADGEEAVRTILEDPWDLILLDVMLPKKSGYDVCREVRKAGIVTPILMLTARGEEIDKVLGLELGADDYITKPFSLRELLARIKAVLRRVGQKGEMTGEIELGKLHINFSTYQATSAGQEISMSHKEFEILKFLWEHRGGTVSRENLLEKIWGYGNTTTRTVDNFIVKLRQKIEPDPAQPKYLITVHGIGYKMVDA
jgi:DNA-binding response OmpR family regulator